MRERPRISDPAICYAAATALQSALEDQGEPAGPGQIEELAAVLSQAVQDSGVRLARRLAREHAWEVTPALVSVLDTAHAVLAAIHRREVAAWVRVEGVRPCHQVGDEVHAALDGTTYRGTITAIESPLARYLVAIPPFGRVAIAFENVLTPQRLAA